MTKDKDDMPLSEKLFIMSGLFVVFFLMPYAIITNTANRQYHLKAGILEIKGVCIENDLRNKGRVIKYKFEFEKKTYLGYDHIMDNIRWNSKIQVGDSILIQVSSIDPEYNFLD